VALEHGVQEAANMDPQKLTVMSRQAITDAQNEARRRQHNEVETWHLLHALLAQDNGLVPVLVEKLGLTASALQLAVERELDRLPRVSGSVDVSKVYVTQAVNEVLTRAEEEAAKLKDEFVSVEHLFLGLLEVAKPEALGKLFKSFNLDRAKVLKALREMRGSQRVTSDNPEATYQALEKYGLDLVALAKKGKMDPVIGRDDEIRRVIQVLSRRTKNNPVLIGEPGVGKTAIVEGLALRVDSDQPDADLHENALTATAWVVVGRIDYGFGHVCSLVLTIPQRPMGRTGLLGKGKQQESSDVR